MDGTDKVAEWKLLLLVQQHIEEGIYFVFRSGEEDKRIGCSQDKGGRIQSIAYSQPAKSGKEGVDCVSKFRMLIIVTVSHFIKIQKKARWLIGITQVLLPRDSGLVLDQERVIKKEKSDHSKPGHAQVTSQVQKCTYYAAIRHRYCSVNCDLHFYG